jgi:hypothetical protein
MKKKTPQWMIITAVVLLLLAVGVGYAFREYNRKEPQTGDRPAVFTMAASELMNQFRKDEKTANLKYLDKVIEVSGKLKSVDTGDKGELTLVLNTSEELSSVRCSIDSLYTSQTGPLVAGNPVKVKGICTGYIADELLGADIILKKSLVITH